MPSLFLNSHYFISCVPSHRLIIVSFLPLSVINSDLLFVLFRLLSVFYFFLLANEMKQLFMNIQRKLN